MGNKFNFETIPFRGDFVGGRFVLKPDADLVYEVKSPADKNDLVMKVSCSYAAAEEGVHHAAKARDPWARTSFAERRAYLDRFGEILSRDSVLVRDRIARETGKPLWEAALEISTVKQRIQTIVAEFLKDGWDSEVEIGNGQLAGAYRAKPRGSMLVLSHFNRPLENPLSYIVPGLLAGNTIVFKPNKKCPALGQYLAEAFHEVGLPPGVFNVVHGGREMARRMAQLSDLDTIFYAGDYEFGKILRRDTFEHSEKLLILETGGKNPAIVFDDADLDLALREIIISAYQTCGQQPQATSRLILGKKIAEPFLERLHEAAKQIVIGHPFDETDPPFMGPLIDRKAMDRYLTFQGTAVREQAECIMRGKTLTMDTDGFFVSPSVYLFKDNDLKKAWESTYLQTEIFGPSLGVQIASTMEEAIALANANNYGLSASVFTTNSDLYREIWHGLRFGAIYWNCGTLRNLANFRLSGTRRSFKASPLVRSLAGYMTYPVGSIENGGQATTEISPPGLVFN